MSAGTAIAPVTATSENVFSGWYRTDDSLYSALVIVIILTTVVTVPALKFALTRKPPRSDAPA